MTKAQALLDWIDARFPLTSMWKEHLSEYYAPKNFNFWYYFGSLALMVLVIQIVSGIFLTMHYKPDAAQKMSATKSTAKPAKIAAAVVIGTYCHFPAGLFGSRAGVGQTGEGLIQTQRRPAQRTGRPS